MYLHVHVACIALHMAHEAFSDHRTSQCPQIWVTEKRKPFYHFITTLCAIVVSNAGIVALKPLPGRRFALPCWRSGTWSKCAHVKCMPIWCRAACSLWRASSMACCTLAIVC
jgi:hypothetical protein